jgi:hypothetical protein
MQNLSDMLERDEEGDRERENTERKKTKETF